MSMKVIGCVAHVVGIVALVGQCLNGIVKLRKLVLSLTQASFKTLGDCLERIESPQTTLKAVHELTETIPSGWSQGSGSLAIELLASQGKKCPDDTIGWLKRAEKTNPT